jgi:hypothetical protein
MTMATWPTIETENPLQIAKKLGYSIAGKIGEEAFVELELSFATRFIGRFSDAPLIRTNQNLLLYWKPGFYKSTILKQFSKTIPKHLKIVDLSSMTQERIYGSISEKKKDIILPAFTNDVHFAIISEMTSLFGQRDSMKNFTNTMNLVLEGETVTRQILKMAYGEISEDKLANYEKLGVKYDTIKGEISYKPNAVFWVATRPLDNRYFTYLNTSGHLSRYHPFKRISDNDVANNYAMFTD